MISCEHKTLTDHHSCFQHIISHLARAVKFTPLRYRSSQEVMHAHSWEADRIFQDVNALVSVEARDVEVVVVRQPVCEGRIPILLKALHS